MVLPENAPFSPEAQKNLPDAPLLTPEVENQTEKTRQEVENILKASLDKKSEMSKEKSEKREINTDPPFLNKKEVLEKDFSEKKTPGKLTISKEVPPKKSKGEIVERSGGALVGGGAGAGVMLGTSSMLNSLAASHSAAVGLNPFTWGSAATAGVYGTLGTAASVLAIPVGAYGAYKGWKNFPKLVEWTKKKFYSSQNKNK